MNLVEAVVVTRVNPVNVEQIIRSLKSQTIPCTITVCDCHLPEYSLSQTVISSADKYLQWHGSDDIYSRYHALSSYNHLFTLFIDENCSINENCVESFLNASYAEPNFGAFGLKGAIIDPDINEYWRPFLNLTNSLLKTDFVQGVCFVKTSYLHHVITIKNDLFYFNEEFPEDDILLCASLKITKNLSTFILNDAGLILTDFKKPPLPYKVMFHIAQKKTEFIKKLVWHGWSVVVEDRPKINGVKSRTSGKTPKFSICMIVLNEAEFIKQALTQIYDWDCCHEIIIIEGSVDLYPKQNLSKDGLSGDGTTELIKRYADPQKKIQYVSGRFKDKVSQRNEYAKRVTGTHVLVLDVDEFYSKDSLDKLKQDVMLNPNTDVFTFNFSQDSSKRTYFHLWHGFKNHVVGGYWDVMHNRIYKWEPGTMYHGKDHNEPVKPDGTIMNSNSHHNICTPTNAKCIHLGFLKKRDNQEDKNAYYIARGEGKEVNPNLKSSTHMTINCRLASENWAEGMFLPYNARIFPFDLPLPEALLG